jgi:hypothetical protein
MRATVIPAVLAITLLVAMFSSVGVDGGIPALT